MIQRIYKRDIQVNVLPKKYPKEKEKNSLEKKEKKEN